MFKIWPKSRCGCLSLPGKSLKLPFDNYVIYACANCLQQSRGWQNASSHMREIINSRVWKQLISCIFPVFKTFLRPDSIFQETSDKIIKKNTVKTRIKGHKRIRVFWQAEMVPTWRAVKNQTKRVLSLKAGSYLLGENNYFWHDTST